MASVSELLSQIDRLVLDYLERRWKIPKKNFHFHAQQNEHSGEDKLETTLEEVYFHFVGSSKQRNRSVQNMLSPIQDFCSKVQVLSMQEPLPHLPPEVVEQILIACPVKQLYSLRSLNRRMNEILSKRLQHSSKRLHLFMINHIEKFLRTFEGRNRALRHAFGTIALKAISCRYICQILDLFGTQQIIKLEEVSAKDLSLEVLNKMQNVVLLSIDIYRSNLVVRTKLLRLRHLRLSHCDNRLKFEHLQSWLRLAPALQVFECDATDLLTHAQAKHLFQSHLLLSRISFCGTCISWRDNMVEVALTHASSPETQVEYADYVRTMRVSRSFAAPLLSLPSLTHLTLISEHPSRPTPLQLGATPLLTHVTLSELTLSEVLRSGQNSIFEGVVSLCLADSYWIWPKGQPLLLHRIFPKIRKLQLVDIQTKEFITYLVTYFKDISSLSLKHFDRGFNEVVPPDRIHLQKGIIWPFSKFQDLRNLELICIDVKSMRPTVMALVTLTLHKCLQPLDKLMVGFFGHKLLPVEEERQIFYSLSHLNYHKNLEFSTDGVQ